MRKTLGTSFECKLFLFALLVTYGLSSHAGTLCSGACPPDVPPPGEIISPPILTIPLPKLSPSLLQLIPDQGGPTSADLQNPLGFAYAVKQYGFAVFTSAPMVRITIPYFSDSLLSVASVPTDWSLSFGTADVFSLGHGAGYMAWTFTGTAAPTGTPWLSFGSAYGPASSTYRVDNMDGTITDIAGGFIALSPSATEAGLQPATVAAVPEPETFAMLMAGLSVIGATARRRKHQG
jgi:hypothetical protein